MSQPHNDKVQIVLNKEQAALVDATIMHHAALLNSAKHVACHAFLAGMKLNRLKDSLPHGQFMPVCEQFLPGVTHYTVTKYMALYSKLQPSCNLAPNDSVKLLSNGHLALGEKEEAKIVKAFAEATDGKSLTELYRDTGIIREKKHQKHTPAKPLSAEELVAAETEQLRAPLTALMDHAAIIRDRGEAENAKVAPKDWAALLDALIPICKLARSLRKSKRAKKGASAK